MKNNAWYNSFYNAIAIVLVMVLVSCTADFSGKSIDIQVEENSPGAPQLFGIPFPQGELTSPDNVRVVNASGEEIPAQVTEVTSWEPADNSVKWAWVYFETGEGSDYRVEYGPNVRRQYHFEERIDVTNNQRSNGEVIVDTGPLRFTINKGPGGFFDVVELDVDGDGFDEEDVIATGEEGRSSFLDLLDDAGIDRSRAVVHRTVKELGTGPLHAVIRVEGEYTYSRDDNNPAPFVTRIHAYAGKSYVKVYHTITYTGDPDKHRKREGQYGAIATEDGLILDEDLMEGDPGWTQPNDRIAAAGLALKYNLADDATYTTSYNEGTWWEPGEAVNLQQQMERSASYSLFQTGPNPAGPPPSPNSSAEERMTEGFAASVTAGDEEVAQSERAPGWVDISDQKWGVTVGFRHFFKEYPKEIDVVHGDSTVSAYIWSPKEEPMSFARSNGEGDSGMIANFAQGLTKTTELVYNFHKADLAEEEVEQQADYILEPPVTHADPSWYAQSKVYGNMAARSERFASYERGLDYKFQWMNFNKHWEPWYGMFDYGDNLTYYFRDQWFQWTNNEPANDFMWWLQYMRTGNRDYYQSAQAASRHTMDVDNIHWPSDPEYVGDTNDAIDAFRVENMPKGSPYVGMGRRHANQHWTSLLSAHVWAAGWVASYYLDGYHRGLDIAEQTGDYYIRRVFGDHGLRGRRLYLSVWNLAEIWDASKKKKYYKELKDRVELMLKLQRDADQGGSLIINRYGYTQVYASRGLSKYYQMTGDEDVKDALVIHARRVRDVPPLNHQMESYLSSISSLVLGYELSGERSFLDEAVRRAEVLKTDQLEQDFGAYANQKELADALESVSNLPDDPNSWRGGAIWKITNGLRIFGWTHIYNVPYLVHSLEEAGYPAE